jgi:alpha-1,3-rhamnosyl/mannosyltransferase
MVHDIYPFVMPEAYPKKKLDFYRKEMPYAFRASRLLLTNSEATKAELLERFPRPEADVVVTPLGPGNVVEPRARESVSREELSALGVPFGRFIFTLSTLEPRKNLPRLVEAFAELANAETNLDLGLVVGGGRGWMDTPIFARVAELGLQDRVTFLGYVPDEDLPTLFAASELAVCPSISEGFGIPVLEAMMLGAPVACSNAGALEEVAGDLATYFDPLEPSDMARAMSSLLDRQDRSELVLRGFERAKLFNWSKTADLTVEALKRLA